MEAKFVQRGFDLEGSSFPFPKQPPPLADQLTPPATKSPTKRSHAVDLSRSSNPSDHPHPFLTNVGKLNGMTIVRGGFRVEMEVVEYTANGMRCFPPPPNAAYGLTSQAYAPEDPVTVNSNLFTPPSTDSSDGDIDADGKHVRSVYHLKNTDMDPSNELLHLDGTATDEISQMLANEMDGFQPSRQQLHPSFTGAKKPIDWEDALILNALDQGKTKGEIIADTIDFKRPSWVMTTPGVSGYLYPAEEQRVSTQLLKACQPLSCQSTMLCFLGLDHGRSEPPTSAVLHEILIVYWIGITIFQTFQQLG